ncbi:hypothetical protein CRUP_009340 [Coryphaenoides rupestris]|nr:hypothetical protein CRUP_009340 [Coryphaenoides rupestris]
MVILIVAFATLIILFFAVTLSESSSSPYVESKDRFPVANLGEDVLLSCELSVAPTTGGVELLWTKVNTSGVVYEYRNRASQLGDQNPQFDGRVHVLSAEVARGNGSLVIAAVRSSDAGVYTCTMSASTGSGSLDITLRTAAYSTPVFIFNNNTLTATGSRWQPKPEATWMAFNGTVLPGHSEFTKNSAGMYSFVSTLNETSVDSFYTFKLRNALVTATSTISTTEPGQPGPEEKKLDPPSSSPPQPPPQEEEEEEKSDSNQNSRREDVDPRATCRQLCTRLVPATPKILPVSPLLLRRTGIPPAERLLRVRVPAIPAAATNHLRGNLPSSARSATPRWTSLRRVADGPHHGPPWPWAAVFPPTLLAERLPRWRWRTCGAPDCHGGGRARPELPLPRRVLALNLVREFCSQAHQPVLSFSHPSLSRRQRRTAAHQCPERPRAEGPGTACLGPFLCALHPAQELRLFCEPCDRPVCLECAATFHRDHRCGAARHVVVRHGDRIRALVAGSLRPRLERLEESLMKVGVCVEISQDALRARVEATADEVRAFARGYATAVEAHCVSLLRRLEELRVQNWNQLHLQKVQLQQALSDARGSVRFAERLLMHGSDAEILSAKGVTLARLTSLVESGYDPSPATVAPDDGGGIRFLPGEGAGEVDGYPVRGRFTLVCRDSAGEPLGRGGENVLVSVVNKAKKNCTVETTVVDNGDGSYAVSYTPVEPGCYSAWVCVKAQHVKGSPFSLNVSRRLRRGFQGCGHGHKGHPGQPHWSCCGSTLEQSECRGPALGPAPGVALTTRGRLRTVEL